MLGLFSIGAIQAQTQWYKATEFSYKLSYTDWSDWESVDISIKIDLTNDIVTIYSQDIQIYKVIQQVESPYDSLGKQVKFLVIDQDYDRGYLRLRIENSGRSQIYIDFADISWVYNVRRTQ